MNEDDLRLERASLAGNVCEDCGDIGGDFHGLVTISSSPSDSGHCRFLSFSRDISSRVESVNQG